MLKKELIESSKVVMKSPSHNQKYLNNITWANKSGIFPKTY